MNFDPGWTVRSLSLVERYLKERIFSCKLCLNCMFCTAAINFKVRCGDQEVHFVNCKITKCERTQVSLVPQKYNIFILRSTWSLKLPVLSLEVSHCVREISLHCSVTFFLSG